MRDEQRYTIQVQDGTWVVIEDGVAGCRPATEVEVSLCREREALRATIRRLETEVYVPGSWQCPKCNFGYTKTNYYTGSGTFQTNTDQPDIRCPNDGETLVPVTWKERCLDAKEGLKEAEAEVVGLRAHTNQMATLLVLVSQSTFSLMHHIKDEDQAKQQASDSLRLVDAMNKAGVLASSSAGRKVLDVVEAAKFAKDVAWVMRHVPEQGDDQAFAYVRVSNIRRLAKVLEALDGATEGEPLPFEEGGSGRE